METIRDRILIWMGGDNVGLSSKAMAFCAADIESKDNSGPADPADFNRCLLLVEQVPEVMLSFPKIATLSSEWNAIVTHWNELKEMFIAEVGWNWSRAHSAPKTYQRMQELRAKPASNHPFTQSQSKEF